MGSTLALVAVGALIGGISTLFPSVLGQTSCKIHRNFIRVIPLPAGARPDLPEMCLDTVKMKRQRIDQLDNSLLGKKIYQCWKRVDKGNYGSDMLCYELYIKNTKGNIEESQVTNYLINNNLCSDLANNQTQSGNALSCGNQDQIKWKTSSIGSGQTVIIKYNALAGWIEIMAA